MRVSKEKLGALHFMVELGCTAAAYWYPDGRHKKGIKLAKKTLRQLMEEYGD